MVIKLGFADSLARTRKQSLKDCMLLGAQQQSLAIESKLPAATVIAQRPQTDLGRCNTMGTAHQRMQSCL